MGVLVDQFGGKIEGELVRAVDWNGMLAGVENLVDALATQVEQRLAPLEASVTNITARVATLEADVASLNALAATVRARMRQLTLSTTTTNFAIGQRGEITARVRQFDGTPLDLSDALGRPWVDFVTVWGSLKAAPGFVSRGGAGDQTLSVQVNAQGEAKVLLRAQHAEAFAEEEELEVEAVLNTELLVGGVATRVADALLASTTPTSDTARPAYRAVTAAYRRTDTRVMQRYLDAYYVQTPSRVAGPFVSTFNQRWRDYRATVLAFVKPDADPLSADGAMGSASIQVSFRDWVAPWIVDDFHVDLGDLVTDFRDRVRPLIRPDLDRSVGDIFDALDVTTRDVGILGRQRHYKAAQQAVRGLQLDTPPAFFANLVQAVDDGIEVQHSLSFNEAVVPRSANVANTARAVAGSAVKAVGEATRVGDSLTGQVTAALSAAETRLNAQVQTQQRLFESNLLREDGPIIAAQREAVAVRGELGNVQRVLDSKANVEFVTSIVRNRV